MIRYLRAFILCLCLLPVCTNAVKVSGLYEVEVPVVDQTKENRKLAIDTALRWVLVKLTGDRNTPGRFALRPILRRAENYVQQYRYKEDEAITTDSNGEATKPLLLWVRCFSCSAGA